MLKLEKVFFMMIMIIFVIHRRQEILVLLTLDFTHKYTAVYYSEITLL